MTGFECFTVVEPATSQRVLQQLHRVVDDDTRCISLVARPDRRDNIVPLYDELVRFGFHLALARFRPGEAEYVGSDDAGNPGNLVVFVGDADDDQPAQLTVARRG